MPKVLAEKVEIYLPLDQLVAIVQQLTSEEKKILRRELIDESWSRRLDMLLQRIWARVEAHPIEEAEVDAEVEKARAARYA
jgi:hypothetical protein